jgi:hypothetical protein
LLAATRHLFTNLTVITTLCYQALVKMMPRAPADILLRGPARLGMRPLLLSRPDLKTWLTSITTALAHLSTKPREPEGTMLLLSCHDRVVFPMGGMFPVPTGPVYYVGDHGPLGDVDGGRLKDSSDGDEDEDDVFDDDDEDESSATSVDEDDDDDDDDEAEVTYSYTVIDDDDDEDD